MFRLVSLTQIRCLHASIVFFLLWGWSISDAVAWKMEAGTLTTFSTSGTPNFNVVNFSQSYTTPPLVFALTTHQGGDPAALRVRNITTTGFEIAVFETPGRDGPHASMTVDYLVIEAGSHTLADGTRLEAGVVNTQRVQRGPGVGGPAGWENIAYGSPFLASPAVLAQIQTMNNEPGAAPNNVSSPWLTAVVDSSTTNGFRLALERSEVSTGAITVDETVAYLAIDSARSSTFIDTSSITVRYDTFLSGSVIDGWDNGCDNVAYPGGAFSGVPLAIASKTTRNDNNGGWLRRCAISSSSLGLTVDEDTFKDAERGHGNEQISGIAFLQAFTYDSTFVPPPPPAIDVIWKLEADQVVLPLVSAGETSFTSVSFRQTYDVIPAVFVLGDSANPEPSMIRVRNVTTSGFEMASVEPPNEDGNQAATTVHYLAIEPGLHTLNGITIEVGSIATNRFQSKFLGSSSWESVSFFSSFSATPVVLAQVQTMVNETGSPPGAPSIPWLTSAMRSLTTTGMQIALERAEVSSGSVASPETIAYLAIASAANSSFVDNGAATVTFESVRSNDSITGNCTAVNFANVYTAPPLVVSTQNSRDGGDGGWLRRCSVTNLQARLEVEEDQTNDSERSHTTERAGLMVFSSAFDAVIMPDPLIYFAMEEGRWQDAASEAIDASPNAFHATGKNGATTRGASPATAGSPGTCRYADLDGVDDHVLLPAGFPNVTGSFSISAWLKTTDKTQGGQRIFADDENNTGGYSLSLGDGGAGRLRFFGRGISPVILDSGDVIQNDTWYFVTAVHDAVALKRRIFVGTSMVAEDSVAYSGAWGSDAGAASIGGETDAGETTARFNGNIDELRIFQAALNATDIAYLMSATHDCPIIIDHFDIAHDSAGINCLAERITITAMDASNMAVDDYTGQINLSTSTSNGDWSLTGSAADAYGTLTPGASDSGLASYLFEDDGDTINDDDGVISLHLNNTHSETFTITVQDSSNGITSTSAPITFRPYGFVVTPAPIGTQIAAKDFSATLTAAGQTPAQPNCGVIEEYTGSKNINFWYDYTDPSVGATAVRIDGSSIAASEGASSAQSVNFTSGVATLTVNYPDAGQIQFFAKDTLGIGEPAGSGDEIIGGVSPFVVRPFAYHIDIVGNPNAADQTGAKFVRAGENFSLTVRPVVWAAADNPAVNSDLADNAVTANFANHNGVNGSVINASLSSVRQAPIPGNDGTLPNSNLSGFSDGAGGGEKDLVLAWDEVGILTFSVSTSNYLGGGQDVGGGRDNVGRFYPARLLVAANAPSFRDGPDASWLCNFTYMEQPFAFNTNPVLTVTGLNTSGATVTNYDSVYWKYATSFAGRSYTSTATSTATLDSLLTGSVNEADLNNLNGWRTYTLSGDTFAYQKQVSAEAAFASAATLNFASSDFTDSDGACYDPDVNGSCDGFAITSIGGTEQRFGRARISNAFGSELASLPVPIGVEYFDGVSFIRNTDDSCSTYSSAAVTLSNFTNNLNGGETTASGAGAFINGAHDSANPIELSAPGDGNDGSVEVGLSPAAWLQFDWDNDSLHDNDPAAIATFGIFQGSNRQIYIQEVLPAAQ